MADFIEVIAYIDKLTLPTLINKQHIIAVKTVKNKKNPNTRDTILILSKPLSGNNSTVRVQEEYSTIRNLL